MPALGASTLARKLAASLPRDAQILTDEEDHRPLEAMVPGLGKVRIYLWSLTPDRSKKGRPKGEYKIQLILPGQDRKEEGAFAFSSDALVALLGYSAEFDLFVAWQASLNSPFAYSKNVQVRDELLDQAQTTGWAVAPPRELDLGDEVRVAFAPAHLLHYLQTAARADRESQDAASRELLFLASAPKPPPATNELVDAEDTSADLMAKPFNPAAIRIDQKTMTIDLLTKRITAGEIDLAPAFQRAADLWSPKTQSRLIESILIRIPIPAFYLDATDDEKWLVVDGLQRLTAIRRFVVLQDLELADLEFLPLNGKRWADLPRPLQRRIEETQVNAYLIQPGTPAEVKFNIFKRINTGGLPLSPQEIRHALNQGPAAELLRDLAKSDSFSLATAGGIRDDRMTDRECVLRFLAFTMTEPAQYRSQDLDTFLNAQMRVLNSMSEADRLALAKKFKTALDRAVIVFGKDAFRKRYNDEHARKPINKALFETWTVNLAALSDAQASLLSDRAETIRSKFIALMNDRDFELSVTSGTGDLRRVSARFSRIRSLLAEALS